MIADVDELHDYPVPLTELIDAAETADSPIVEGLLLNRVSADGSMRPWSPEKGLDQTYPLGGNPGKIVAAHSSVRRGLASHRSLDEFPVNRPLVPVHHFKWRAEVLQALKRRGATYTTAAWRETGP
ncbi:hypothetical protein ABZ519_42020 [Streptomyces collinus]|uniref:hypothetical protein n=1 Tax=Streptomyces collinus TaxID=42684 RepID=UPI0033E2DDB6